MNSRNPFTTILPPGSPLARRLNLRRSRVRGVVITILAVQAFILAVFLIQGCLHTGRSKPGAASATSVTRATAFRATTNAPPVAAPESAAKTVSSRATSASTARTYSVVKGDTYERIAKVSRVSLGALAKANPGVDRARLRVGQRLHLPKVETQPSPATNGRTFPPGTRLAP